MASYAQSTTVSVDQFLVDAEKLSESFFLEFCFGRNLGRKSSDAQKYGRECCFKNSCCSERPQGDGPKYGPRKTELLTLGGTGIVVELDLRRPAGRSAS